MDSELDEYHIVKRKKSSKKNKNEYNADDVQQPSSCKIENSALLLN